MSQMPLNELRRVEALLRGTVKNAEHYAKALDQVKGEIAHREKELADPVKLSDIGDEEYTSLYKKAIDALGELMKFHLASCSHAENESVAALHQAIHDQYGKYADHLGRIHEGDFSGLGK